MPWSSTIKDEGKEKDHIDIPEGKEPEYCTCGKLTEECPDAYEHLSDGY